MSITIRKGNLNRYSYLILSYGVRVQYSFLSDYINAVHSLNLTWPVFEGDFFVYNDNGTFHLNFNIADASFWSGYYTSRPWLKRYVRTRDALLNVGEQLFVLGRALNLDIDFTEAFDNLELIRQASSIATHHDAGISIYPIKFLVSGTETQEVAEDYALRLQIGTEAGFLFVIFGTK